MTRENANTIMKIEMDISYGVPVKVLVPEYLLSADGPLAIRLKGDEKRVQIWAFRRSLVSVKFMMVEDDTPYTTDERHVMDNITVWRHFGTVFDGDGKAIHLLILV